MTLANQLNKLSGVSGGNDGEQVTASDWTISPASVEVNYDGLSNSLTISAASLHPLYFHPLQPDYINYAGIGVSIARGFISALSPSNLRFDETGCFIETQFPATFWTDLHLKSQCYINQYVARYKLQAARRTGEDVDEEEVSKIAARAQRSLDETVLDVQAFQLIYESLKNASADANADVTSESEQMITGHTVTLEHANVTLTIDQLFSVVYESNFCQTSTAQWLRVEQLVSHHLPARERGDLPVFNCPQWVSWFNCSHLQEGKVDKCSVW